jgi:hypothetical protein
MSSCTAVAIQMQDRQIDDADVNIRKLLGQPAANPSDRVQNPSDRVQNPSDRVQNPSDRVQNRVIPVKISRL